MSKERTDDQRTEKAESAPSTLSSHVQSYKQFLKNPLVLKDMMREFVRDELLEDLDFSMLTLYSEGYVEETLRERHSDLVWLVGRKGKKGEVALLFDFQSQPYYWMAERVLAHVCMFLLDFVETKNLSAESTLPPVFHLVIYNGKGEWNAPVNAKDLFEDDQDTKDRPEYEYTLLDIKRISEHQLNKENNLFAYIAKLEQADIEDIPNIVRDLLNLLKKIRAQGGDIGYLNQEFSIWITRVLLKTIAPDKDFPELHDLQEVHTMLEEHAHEWKNGWIRHGEAIGEARGEINNSRKFLQHLLETRFGPLPQYVLSWLADSTNVEELVALGPQVFQINSLDEFMALVPGKRS